MIRLSDLVRLLFHRQDSGEEWPTPNPRRVKVITISSTVFEELFRTGHRSTHYEVTGGLPPDGRIVSGRYDPTRNAFELVVWSGEFPEVPDGMLADDLSVAMRRFTIAECPWDAAEAARVVADLDRKLPDTGVTLRRA